jgi:hypothetical protein
VLTALVSPAELAAVLHYLLSSLCVACVHLYDVTSLTVFVGTLFVKLQFVMLP